jgi:hypothetical protein
MSIDVIDLAGLAHQEKTAQEHFQHTALSRLDALLSTGTERRDALSQCRSNFLRHRR